MGNEKEFVHLHVHTEYSVLDGLNKVKALVDRVKNLGMSACAITDHGTLSGVIEFYKACKEAEIKPILGMEAYVTQNQDDLPNEQKVRDNRHLVLLAQNMEGFKNLIWLNNRAYLHNFYYNPRIWIGHLASHNAGLIVTTACIAGVMAKKATIKEGLIVEPGGMWDPETKSFDDPDKIGRKWIEELMGYFPDRLYLEVQDHPNWEQIAYNRWLRIQAEVLDLPLVMTCDAHYPRAEDKEVHDLLMAQQFKTTLAEHQAKDQFECLNYIREPHEMEMASRRIETPKAFWNTRDIAERCNLTLELGKYQTPNFDVTKTDDYQDFLKWQSQKS